MTKPTRSPAQNLASAKRIATTINVILVAALGAFSYMTFKRHHEMPVPAEGILFSEIQRDGYDSDTANPRPPTSNSVPIADTAGLEKLAEQLRNPRPVLPKDAHRILRDSIVQVMRYERQACSGLLLTYDGWIATAAHCLPVGATAFSYGIRHQEQDYPIIDTHYLPERDVLLIKAEMDGRPEPLPLLFSSDLPRGRPVTVRGMHYGKLFEKEGIVTTTSKSLRVSDYAEAELHDLNDYFSITTAIDNGMSGSMIIDDATGAFAGVISVREYEGSGVAKAKYLAELVQRVAGK